MHSKTSEQEASGGDIEFPLQNFIQAAKFVPAVNVGADRKLKADPPTITVIPQSQESATSPSQKVESALLKCARPEDARVSRPFDANDFSDLVKHAQGRDAHKKALKKNTEQQTHRTLSQTFSDPNEESRKNKFTVLANRDNNNHFREVAGESASKRRECKEENNYLSSSVDPQTVLRDYRGSSIDRLIAKDPRFGSQPRIYKLDPTAGPSTGNVVVSARNIIPANPCEMPN